MKNRKLRNWIALLSILALFSSEITLYKLDKVNVVNIDNNLVAFAQLCCCGNDITTCADCCCSTPDSRKSNKRHEPTIVSRNCNQDYGFLSQKVDYCVSASSLMSHFPFTTSLKNSIVILENSPSTQLYKPPRV